MEWAEQRTTIRAMLLFRKVALEVGERLGYAYPIDLDQRVTAYVQEMKDRQVNLDNFKPE